VIDPRTFRPLSLDAEAVRGLLPHRPPLLLVDGVEAISDQPPALRAFKLIAATEPVLAGHFPDQPLWPGVYSIEGLAQACGLLGALRAKEGEPKRGAVLAAADVKLTMPVQVGQRLDYLVVLTHTFEPVFRFDVEASVGGRTVAKGTLTLAVVPR
jgi:3-hydroxyacyl-[acyl-carrier-protein] dehydratase